MALLIMFLARCDETPEPRLELRFFSLLFVNFTLQGAYLQWRRRIPFPYPFRTHVVLCLVELLLKSFHFGLG